MGLRRDGLSAFSGRLMSILIRNLKKSFGDMRAVAGIDLQVAEGEMLVLLGPSGCGKTTTMRCIAGLETPDSGYISIGGSAVFDDRDGTNVPVHKRQVGMVFQSYAIWPHMTVFENVSFSLEMKGVGREETRERVHDILRLVGLEGFAEKAASYLSGGQMQRVALARSLVMRPSVLLFDEPLSNLDARLRDHLRVQLRELQTQLKISSVYVTHDQHEALALADQIVVMDHGEVLQTGDPVDLYQAPRSSKIAQFLGYSNIFAVRKLERADPVWEAQLDNGRAILSAEGAPAGAKEVTVCVRPDDVSIELRSETGLEPVGQNVIKGEVILASFLGSHMQYRVRATEGEVWDVLSVEVSNRLKLGFSVMLRIDPSRVHLLPRH